MEKIKLPLLYDYVFPNFILPNALPTELSIINYLHSQHSNRINDHSFFDEHHSIANYDNLLTYLFDYDFGHWSSSWGGDPCITTGNYSHLIDIDSSSLYFGKRKYTKYIYPIRVTPHFNNFTGVCERGRKINGEIFWKFMSAQALSDARKGNALILLDYCLENFVEKFEYENLHSSLKNSKIPKEQILLIMNSFNAQQLYEEWFTEDQQRITVRNFPYLMSAISYRANDAEQMISETRFKLSKNQIRKNYFVYKNHRPRSQRKAFLYSLYSNNLLDNSDWSWITDEKINHQDMLVLESIYNLSVDTEKVKEINNLIPRKLASEPNAKEDTAVGWKGSDSTTYSNSYFDVCTETRVNGEHNILTEKIFFPIAYFQPFLFYGIKGSLKLLRQQGFKTFHPYIDESYDDEPNIGLRLKMIVEEVKKLCSLSKEELHSWYWNLEDILIYNHRHLKSIYLTDPSTMSLFEYLDKKINS